MNHHKWQGHGTGGFTDSTCCICLGIVRILPAHVSEKEIIQPFYPLQVSRLVRDELETLRARNKNRWEVRWVTG